MRIAAIISGFFGRKFLTWAAPVWIIGLFFDFFRELYK